MSHGVVTVDGDTNPSVLEAVDLMVKNRVGAVIVLASGKHERIITERDILRKVSARNRKPQDSPARGIMSTPLLTVKTYDSADTAAGIMSKNKIKRLAVTKRDGAIVGILSATDITRRLAKILADDSNQYRSFKAVLDL